MDATAASYPAEIDADLVFDSAVASQFLVDGDIIERGGMAIQTVAISRNEAAGVVGFSYYNRIGGIQGATIPWVAFVTLGTIV